MIEIEIQWEGKIKRDICMAGAHWAGGSLILEHGDDKGISLFDPVERRELWEYRLKGEVVGSVWAAGDWIMFKSSFALHLVERGTGEGAPATKLKADDIFRFASGSHAYFRIKGGGTGIMDLSSGGMTRFSDQSQDLTPCIGSGDFFMGLDQSSGSAYYYVGRPEPDTGRLLKASARPFKMPESEVSRVFVVSPPAFAVTRAEGDARIGIYEWSGELVAELEIRGFGLGNHMTHRAKFLLSPDGELESLLVTYFSGSQTRIFLLDLKNQGSIRWTTEVVGPMFDELPIAGNHLFWCTRGMEGGKCTGMAINLLNGEAAPFIDEPVSPWMAADGRGVFFGKEKKGRKHIAYGKIP